MCGLTHHTGAAWSELQWASALDSEEDASEVAHSLEAMTTMEI